jgi:hypothetical protein
MSTRRAKIVLLCEDSQQEAFTRRFLEGMGWNTRELRVEKSPSGKGSGEQWVREKFADELRIYRERRNRAASGLIAIIDADVREVQDRIRDFEAVCDARQIPFREDRDTVAIAVPKRNIETWIHYLNGESVNEENALPKLERERLCQPAVNNLVRLCKARGLADDAPPSLQAACQEYQDRIIPLR